MNGSQSILKGIARKRDGMSEERFRKISGTINLDREISNHYLNILKNSQYRFVMVSEISRIGRRVVDVLNFVELLHEKGIALYIQQFNMLTLENGQENPIAKMLLQMLSIGAEMENNQRKIRQREGIKLAQMKNIYTGRKKGAKTSPSKLMSKYKNVADLLDKSELSVRRIAGITGHSINTVRKVKQLKRFD